MNYLTKWSGRSKILKWILTQRNARNRHQASLSVTRTAIAQPTIWTLTNKKMNARKKKYNFFRKKDKGANPEEAIINITKIPNLQININN